MRKEKNLMRELLGDTVYQPMRFREIAGLLRLSKDEKKDLYRVLDDLVAEGKANLDSKGRYSKANQRKRGKEKLHQKQKKEKRKEERYEDRRTGRHSGRRNGEEDPELRLAQLESEYADRPQAEGTFIGHPKGFGFVEVEGEENDIFIPEDSTGTARHSGQSPCYYYKRSNRGQTPRRNCDKDSGARHDRDSGNLRKQP